MFKIIYLIYKIIESKVNSKIGCSYGTLDFNFIKDDSGLFKNLDIIVTLFIEI